MSQAIPTRSGGAGTRRLRVRVKGSAVGTAPAARWAPGGEGLAHAEAAGRDLGGDGDGGALAGGGLAQRAGEAAGGGGLRRRGGRGCR